MSLSTILQIFLMAALWGPSFLFIKLVSAEMKPLTAASFRVGIAALTLYLLLKCQKKKLMPFGKIWGHFFIMGMFANAIPFCLFFYGEMSIDSCLAALINGAPPIFTAILAHYFLKDEPLTFTKIVGILLGMAGLLMLFLPSLSDGIYGTPWGILAVILATFCYAIGFIYGKKYLRGLPTLVAPLSQLIAAGVILIPIALIVERPFDLSMPSWTTIGSLLFLGVLGTGVANVFYYRVLETAGAMALSTVSYLLPVVGMSLGVLFLKEPLTWNAVVGGVLILIAMMTVNGRFKTQMVPGRSLKS